MNRLLISLMLLMFSSEIIAGVTLGATRVIYHGRDKEASIVIENHKDSLPFLVQSWVEHDILSEDDIPFVVTPPLLKLASDSQNTIRISYIRNTLPADRESLFRLSINAIPASENSHNRLLITTKSIVKLIYRPASLNDDEAREAVNKINFTKQNDNQVMLSNVTPYYINIGKLVINNQLIENAGVIAPFSSINVSAVYAEKNTAMIKAINDFGGLTPERTAEF